MSNSLYPEILLNGYTTTYASSENTLKQDMLHIASILGIPKATRHNQDIVQEIRPLNSSQSYPKSLSNIYSDGIFPLHIDTSHWLIPCRYILLGCVSTGSGNRPTLLVDSNKIGFFKENREALV